MHYPKYLLASPPQKLSAFFWGLPHVKADLEGIRPSNRDMALDRFRYGRATGNRREIYKRPQRHSGRPTNCGVISFS